MLRISKLTDYGTVILAEMARDAGRRYSAHELAERTGVAAPTVAKLLKALVRAELVDSRRGAHGGYRLTRAPVDITAAEVIDAIEGRIALTECASGDSQCSIEHDCSVGHNWQRINAGIRRALEAVSLADFVNPMTVPLMDFRTSHRGSASVKRDLPEHDV